MQSLDKQMLIAKIALLRETESCLRKGREFSDYAHIEESIRPILEVVKAHVLEFEQLIQ
jgi:hypothetical protein